MEPTRDADSTSPTRTLRDRLPHLSSLSRDWFMGASSLVGGFMLAYLIFPDTFGPLYSIRTLAALAAASPADPYAPINFTLRFYLIIFFAAPLGLTIATLRKQQGKTILAATALIALTCLADIIRFHGDTGTVFTLISFTALLTLMLIETDKRPAPQQRNEPRIFLRALATFYALSVAALYLLNPNLTDLTTIPQLQSYLTQQLYTQLTAIPLALAAAAVSTITFHRLKPPEQWFALNTTLILTPLTLAADPPAAPLFAALTTLLAISYRNQKTQPPPLTPQTEQTKQTQLNIIEKLSTPETSNLIDSAGKLLNEYVAYLKIQSRQARISGASDAQPQQAAAITKSLEKLANEATNLRETITGEILRVKALRTYTPQLLKTTYLHGQQRSAGVNHYLICSRTGHGKTTLMKNLMQAHGDFAFLVLDRHSEYEPTDDSGEVITLDETIDVSETERILAQIPKTKLSNEQSLIRDSIMFSIEQQFNASTERSLPPPLIREVSAKLAQGKTIILRPGAASEIAYTRISHDIIQKVFEAKIREKQTSPLAVVNEEAHNSYEIAENGMERNRAHIMVRIILEGRKYNTSLINLSSDPENVPKNIKDNSTLIIGAIGTPALKSLIGDKLGRIYIGYIHGLRTGRFFIDQVDADGDYITFPNTLSEEKAIEPEEAEDEGITHAAAEP